MRNASDTTAVFTSTISKEYDVVMGSIYILYCVLSLLGNCILLLVAHHKRSSLKPPEFFIINLSISDLGMTLFLFPLAIPSSFSHRWLFGETACQLYAMCGVLFGLCSLTNLTALSLVCCLKVCFPNYGNKFSWAHARLLVVGVWCYASVFALGPLAQWGRYGTEPYGTACCIDWHAPNHELSAMSYIVCLFIFCYALPSTIIFLSYSSILLTVRGSRQAVQQHVSPQAKSTSAHSLIVKLSVAVCIGFLCAWTPYAGVAMWSAFSDAARVPPSAFAVAAVFAKSSTVYNPAVYLLCKPNFRECLYRDTFTLWQRIYTSSPRLGATPESSDTSIPACFSNGQVDRCEVCLHYVNNPAKCHVRSTQRTARILTGSVHREVTLSQLAAAATPLADFL
ncbi:LOW QUALITY PROTEIN: opsin 7, group member d [Syngnathus typhle]